MNSFWTGQPSSNDWNDLLDYFKPRNPQTIPNLYAPPKIKKRVDRVQQLQQTLEKTDPVELETVLQRLGIR